MYCMCVYIYNGTPVFIAYKRVMRSGTKRPRKRSGVRPFVSFITFTQAPSNIG